jgi:hypothetical protein
MTVASGPDPTRSQMVLPPMLASCFQPFWALRPEASTKMRVWLVPSVAVWTPDDWSTVRAPLL